MMTGATQSQLQAKNLVAISASEGNVAGKSLPVSGGRVAAADSKSTVVHVETASALADLASQYDVRSMSPQDMATMSQTLYDNGAISFQDHALLSFQPELSAQFSKVAPGASGKSDTPRDFIAQWEAQLQIHDKLGDVGFAKNDQRMLNILGNLAALRESAASP